MKCPRCQYLGFDTGDRCRNCGNDFSLLALADAAPAQDLMLRSASERSGEDDGVWLDAAIAPAPSVPAAPPYATFTPVAIREEEAVPPTPVPPAAPEEPADGRLPLFSRQTMGADGLLVKAPVAPRPPLSVRRTPATPRLRTPWSISRGHADPEPVLDLADPPAPDPVRVAAPVVAPTIPVAPVAPVAAPVARTSHEACPPVPRAAAAAIDFGILLAVDLAVGYFTLRMAALDLADWRLLPVTPLLLFLAFVKLGYFMLFTAFGGQTIGKMAVRIRVVADDDRYLEPSRAVRRTLAAAGSALTLGLGFVPALVGSSRRALHDRVAHTRVVALPSS